MLKIKPKFSSLSFINDQSFKKEIYLILHEWKSQLRTKFSLDLSLQQVETEFHSSHLLLM